MNRVIVICIAFVLFACKHSSPVVTLFKTNDYIISDTSMVARTFLPWQDSISEYPIYYLGEIKDSVGIGARCIWNSSFRPVEHGTMWTRNYSSKTLGLFVDTSIKTTSTVEYYSDYPNINWDSTLHYHSFLVTLKNISDSNLFLGHNRSLFSINREAKNRNGEWVKIDKKISEIWMCGTGHPIIYLKPNEYLISKVKRYKGDFVTDFRLAYCHGPNTVYSNIFKDSIDERTLYLLSENK